MDNFFNIGLPKWPALLVVGEPVTIEQAKEIILRTDYLSFSSNDREFDAQLNSYFYDVKIDKPGYRGEDEAICEKLGLPKDSWDEIYAYKDLKRSEINPIDLEYLYNSRIVSSWIGGPHGWCDWSGKIGCTNYNIGKYPSVNEIYYEWCKIAQAFPFLNLTSQLLSSESGQDDAIPVIEFKIKDGLVEMSKPDKAIATSKFGSDDITSRFTNPYSERGCTIEMFKNAVDLVRSKFNVSN